MAVNGGVTAGQICSAECWKQDSVFPTATVESLVKDHPDDRLSLMTDHPDDRLSLMTDRPDDRLSLMTDYP